MGKKKTGAMPTSAPKQKKKMVIDMTEGGACESVPGTRISDWKTHDGEGSAAEEGMEAGI